MYTPNFNKTLPVYLRCIIVNKKRAFVNIFKVFYVRILSVPLVALRKWLGDLGEDKSNKLPESGQDTCHSLSLIEFLISNNNYLSGGTLGKDDRRSISILPPPPPLPVLQIYERLFQ